MTGTFDEGYAPKQTQQKDKQAKAERLKSNLKSEKNVRKCYKLITEGYDVYFIIVQINQLNPDFNFEAPVDDEGNTFMTLAAKTGMW